MADAGKIMIMPKGAYDAGVSYEILDLVTHNDKVWVAKRNVIGVEPSEENSDDWFLMINNSDLQDIIDGTTPVGDSNKLGGKDASEYVTKDGGIITSVDGLNVQYTDNGYGRIKKNHSATVDAGTFLGDYAKDGTSAKITVKASDQTILFNKNDGSNLPILHGGNIGNYALPLSGGTLTGGYVPLTLEDGASSGAYLGFKGTGGDLGFFGFTKASVPSIIESDGATSHKLLHTGNKPTGTYTGNGSTSKRSVAIGGFGSALLIRAVGSNTFCIVTRAVTLCVNSSGVVVLQNSQVQIDNITTSMTLTLNSNSAYVNENGRTYDYAVL